MYNLDNNKVSSTLIANLAEIGINYDADIWALPSNATSPADTVVTINWQKFLGLQNNVQSLNHSYSVFLKHLTAGLILGLDGYFASSTIKQRMSWLKGFLWKLQKSGHEVLSIVDAFTVSRILSEDINITRPITKSTFEQRINTLNQAHRMRFFTGTGFAGDPITKRSLVRIKYKLRVSTYWEAPPEPVCLFLLRESIRFIESYSKIIIDEFLNYINNVNNAIADGCNTKKRVSRYVNSIITEENYRAFLEKIHEAKDWSPSPASLRKLVRLTFTACFIVITFTSGPRVSEIRRACSKSLKPKKHNNGSIHFYYHATRSKHHFSAETKTSLSNNSEQAPWILAPAAVDAFRILIRLSEPFRKKSGIDNLWLTTQGNALWPFNPKSRFTVISSSRININLNQFSEFTDLNKTLKWSGRLHSHMGRKHLARFVAKRDRSMLGELAQQFSHVSPRSVDISYAQPDSEFRRMVQEELVKEMNYIGNELLLTDPNQVFTVDSSSTSNRIGKFLGEFRSSKDVKLLISSGILLFPCQWGVCLYREETSACRGSKTQPNFISRTPTTCSSCSNFFATSMHYQWWDDYCKDSDRILKQNNIPIQTKLLLKERLATAKVILSALAGGEA